MPSTASRGPTEADIIFNRANVALARSQALIDSWLPPKTAEEIANTKSEEEIRKEEEEIFKPSPELLGVGAIAPENELDAIIKRRGPSNQRLLEQLLGKKAAKGHIASKAANSRNNEQQATKNAPSRAVEEDSDDEEQGRASMVASKSARRKQQPPPVPNKQNTPREESQAESDTVQSEVKVEEKARSSLPKHDSSEEENPRPTKKRPASYLDQLLAEKANKKKKKKQKAGD